MSFLTPIIESLSHSWDYLWTKEGAEDFSTSTVESLVTSALFHKFLGQFGFLRPVLGGVSLLFSAQTGWDLLQGKGSKAMLARFLGDSFGGALYGGLYKSAAHFVTKNKIEWENINLHFTPNPEPDLPVHEMPPPSQPRVLLGVDEETYKAELRRWRGLSDDEKKMQALQSALDLATLENRTVDVEVIRRLGLAYLELNVEHYSDFVVVADEAKRLGVIPKKIASWGSGFFQWHSSLNATINPEYPRKAQLLRYVLQAEHAAFGTTLVGQSKELRYLTALFLRENPTGQLFVIDSDSRVALDLQDPSRHYLTDINIEEVFYKDPREEFKAFWKEWILVNETKPNTVTEIPAGGIPIRIVKTPLPEMKQVHPIQADFLGPWDNIDLAKKADGVGMDLSFWLESHYLLPRPYLSFITIARVVSNTRQGGLICTDLGLNDAGQAKLGIKLIKTLSRFDVGKTYIYQRESIIDDVENLARLEV